MGLPGMLISPFYIDHDDRLLDPLEILTILGPFASVDMRTGSVQLAHHSIRKFLTRRKSSDPTFRLSAERCHFEMAILCLQYLFSVVRSQSIADAKMLAPRWDALSGQFPLLLYTAQYFSYHITMSKNEGEALPLLQQLFSVDDPRTFGAWLAILRCGTSIKSFYVPGRQARRDSVLYHAIAHGLVETTKAILSKGADINEAGGSAGGTLLHAACRNKRPELVGLLLDKGADYEVRNRKGHTAYDLAMYLGHDEILKMFEERQKVPSPSPAHRSRPQKDRLSAEHIPVNLMEFGAEYYSDLPRAPVRRRPSVSSIRSLPDSERF